MYLVRAPCKKTDRSVGMSLDKYEYIIIIRCARSHSPTMVLGAFSLLHNAGASIKDNDITDQKINTNVFKYSSCRNNVARRVYVHLGLASPVREFVPIGKKFLFRELFVPHRKCARTPYFEHSALAPSPLLFLRVEGVAIFLL